MYVLKTMLLCFELNGCMLPLGLDYNNMENWVIKDTKAECEAEFRKRAEEVAEENYDSIGFIHIECEEMKTGGA